jgi:hypothetical protein
MYAQLDALSIVDFHDDRLSRKEWPGGAARHPANATWAAIDANHCFNILLWGEEERARRIDAGVADIAAGKRLLDRYHQRRGDAVEAIDEAILALLAAVEYADNARLSSESPGAMIDRLSVLALNIFHLRELRRLDAGSARVDACHASLLRLDTQRHDLVRCLDHLLTGAYHGQAYFKVYGQLKLYNDGARP